MDIFERIQQNNGPIGELQNIIEGNFAFPKFEGEISNHIFFKDKKLVCWSYNNYLGLASSKEIDEIDAHAQKKWGMTYPMGSRMMTGDTFLHDEFENNIADFIQMEKALLLNFGYQGMLSVVDALLSPNDVVISDEQCHACIIDGIRLHRGKKLIFKHNNIQNLEQQLKAAEEITQKTKGGILVITEGVFSMSGAQGKLKEICDLKAKYDFRLLVDDAHGFGDMGQGNGTVCAHGLENKVDLYFTTFTKSMASFGAIIAGKKEVINYFKYNLRSQLFSKSLPMPIVYGLNERLKIVIKAHDNRKKLFEITALLQDGLKKRKLLSSSVNSYITPVYFNIKLDDVFSLQKELVHNHGVYCSVIIHPVVPKGVVIFRLTPTSLHTKEDVDRTLKSFDTVFKKYMR
ncbi:aminotransferase class I/II-fold pyridoxal phosphate-dependent enzyme [Kordia sp. YSTF-M3]|uniref:Aminotransferase class I/II-fold pyridoxal phosphate-dependent enzyme n=1 Tax=Kordia aestuariivivens TaxID=2759037 RepID=A0ABR7Q470_9FLAO|nr:aminotransferase class I/II-fold pyridoxal phosphate-dependent enzyme [Kordia aestuariivivens]MBC8753356.1 aminotransferase class I/II-fold pyridoxal phosphate-dependent enzyme [Kordia aestuariivivens]